MPPNIIKRKDREEKIEKRERGGKEEGKTFKAVFCDGGNEVIKVEADFREFDVVMFDHLKSTIKHISQHSRNMFHDRNLLKRRDVRKSDQRQGGEKKRREEIKTLKNSMREVRRERTSGSRAGSMLLA